jgi:hypothetical protein
MVLLMLLVCTIDVIDVIIDGIDVVIDGIDAIY